MESTTHKSIIPSCISSRGIKFGVHTSFSINWIEVILLKFFGSQVNNSLTQCELTHSFSDMDCSSTSTLTIFFRVKPNFTLIGLLASKTGRTLVDTRFWRCVTRSDANLPATSVQLFAVFIVTNKQNQNLNDIATSSQLYEKVHNGVSNLSRVRTLVFVDAKWEAAVERAHIVCVKNNGCHLTINTPTKVNKWFEKDEDKWLSHLVMNNYEKRWKSDNCNINKECGTRIQLCFSGREEVRFKIRLNFPFSWMLEIWHFSFSCPIFPQEEQKLKLWRLSISPFLVSEMNTSRMNEWNKFYVQ